MKINFKGTYKSLTDFESDDLSNLTVITGKNGSGKTQLLNAIKNYFPPYKGGDNRHTDYSIEFPIEVKKVQFEGLTKASFITASNTLSLQKMQNYANEFRGLQPSAKELLSFMYNSDLKVKEIVLENSEQLNEKYGSEFSTLLDKVLIESGIRGHLPENIYYIYEKIQSPLDRYKNLLELLYVVKAYKQLDFSEIDTQLFFSLPIPESFIDNTDLFESQLETIFYSYSKRRFHNDYLFYRKSKGNDENGSVSDSEFVNLYPPPWEVINKILRSHNIKLSFEEVKFDNFINSNYTVEIFIKKEGIDKKLTLADLSSGEQIILGLILKLFTSNYYQTLSFPDLILLDEPDVYLHPEMSKLLIDVLHKSFVIDLGIVVIFTTHSPSTIALTPDECIYEMSNADGTSLKKISKDQALNILTDNLPTLSIDYKNHRQVFVESPTDVYYYQRLFDKLNSVHPTLYKLYFISNQMGKGNCAWVTEIVNKLRTSGVTKAYGIIDWDSVNIPSEHVFVHGHNKIYSIENFLCDGIYLTILLMELNAHNIRQELGFQETYMEYQIVNESQELIQKIWDYIIGKIQSKFPALTKETTASIRYSNLITVQIPEWFCNMKGHDLIEKIKATFPALEKYRNEGELQDKLSLIMAKCYPLVSQESVNLLKTICF